MIAALLQILAAAILIPTCVLGLVNARRVGWIRAGVILGVTVYRHEQPGRFWRWAAARVVIVVLMTLVLVDAVLALIPG